MKVGRPPKEIKKKQIPRTIKFDTETQSRQILTNNKRTWNEDKLVKK